MTRPANSSATLSTLAIATKCQANHTRHLLKHPVPHETSDCTSKLCRATAWLRASSTGSAGQDVSLHLTDTVHTYVCMCTEGAPHNDLPHSSHSLCILQASTDLPPAQQQHSAHSITHTAASRQDTALRSRQCNRSHYHDVVGSIKTATNTPHTATTHCAQHHYLAADRQKCSDGTGAANHTSMM